MNVQVARGGMVLAQPASDLPPEALHNGAVAYADGTIVAVGPWPDIAGAFPSAAVLGSSADVVIPGFVNSHHHVGVTPFQLGAPDLPLELWSLARNGVPPVDPYLDTLVAAFGMVESGITTVHHIQSRLGVTSQWDRSIAEVLRAYSDVGMRVTYSVGLRDQSFFVQGDDSIFLHSLPNPLAVQARTSIQDSSLPPREHLQRYFVQLYEACGSNKSDMVRIQLAPLNLHWCSDDALAAVRDLSEQYDVGIHMHLLETAFQKMYAHARTGMSAVAHLDQLGLLSPRFTLGHGVWLTESDISTLAERDVLLCHNPSSNLRLRSGVAPLNDILAGGLGVALGIDEAGINDDRDMFQEMRLALNLHRVPGLATRVPTASDVWRMATEVGARSTGFGDEVGVLRVGAKADFSILDWSAVTGAYLDAHVSFLDALVRRAKPHSITTVVIGGTVVYDGGHFTGVDREAALSELTERMQHVDADDVEKRRTLSEELEPYVRSFYDEWTVDLRTDHPFYGMNARR
jgi:5-methylthioadenosine/S-adenosylhomocysteine deaminase